MIVNIRTQSDADFVRGFVLAQSVPDWLASTYYPVTSIVAFAGLVWSNAGLAASTNVAPGTDGTKWAIVARPPRDLTGGTLLMMARSPAGDNYAPLSVTSVASAGIEITDAANGKFTLTLPLSMLSKMPAGTYDHSLIFVRTDGLHELVWRGTLTHNIGPTR